LHSIPFKRNEIWIELDYDLIEWHSNSLHLKRNEVWIELDLDLIEWNLNSTKFNSKTGLNLIKKWDGNWWKKELKYTHESGIEKEKLLKDKFKKILFHA
jgi:hypothetical protein